MLIITITSFETRSMIHMSLYEDFAGLQQCQNIHLHTHSNSIIQLQLKPSMFSLGCLFTFAQRDGSKLGYKLALFPAQEMPFKDTVGPVSQII